MLHRLCDWSPGRQFNRRKSRIVREFESEQGKAGCGQEFTGGAARGAGDGRIGEADVGGEDVVGGVGVEEEGEEGEAGGKKDREVFASRSENNYYYYQPQLHSGKRCCRNLERSRDRVEFCLQRTSNILDVASSNVGFHFHLS